MSIEGQLTIQLHLRQQGWHCQLSSSRPLYANRLLIGKPIDTVLKIIPMLFNICGKAQTIATLRATESYIEQPIALAIEQQREALIHLESLREQLWQISLNWPKSMAESVDSQLISSLNWQINNITQMINNNQSLLTCLPVLNVIKHPSVWTSLKQFIEKFILGASSQQWLNKEIDPKYWLNKSQSLAGRFLYWLQQQRWQYAGTCTVPSLQQWDDIQLQQRLYQETDRFTQAPDWHNQAQEVSWFSTQLHHVLVDSLLAKYGNGMYTRIIARLVGIADLLHKLDCFFGGRQTALSYAANKGIAHVNAARGRLTHSIQLAGETVEQLHILAPTEWNFHPQGVAVKGLENLQGEDIASIEQQAHCLIHAIDPCVGYQLHVSH